VVATGIDNELREEPNPADSRVETIRARSAAQPAPASRPAAPRPAPMVRPSQPVQPHTRPAAISAAPGHEAEHAPAPASMVAAREALVARASGVTIAPFSPAPAASTTGELDVEMDIQAELDNAPAEAPFIPPVAETAPARMPRVEDFPPVVQRQIEARQGPAPEEDRGPLSLLRRLASVGLGRRDEDPVGAGPPAQQPAQRQPPSRLPPRAQTPPPPPQPRVQAPPAAAPGEHAKRPPAPRAPTPESLYKP